MNNRLNAVIGFVVAGGALVALAGPEPQLAIGIAAILGLGIVLSHPQEIQTLLSTFQSALKPL